MLIVHSIKSDHYPRAVCVCVCACLGLTTRAPHDVLQESILWRHEPSFSSGHRGGGESRDRCFGSCVYPRATLIQWAQSRGIFGARTSRLMVIARAAAAARQPSEPPALPALATAC